MKKSQKNLKIISENKVFDTGVTYFSTILNECGDKK